MINQHLPPSDALHTLASPFQAITRSLAPDHSAKEAAWATGKDTGELTWVHARIRLWESVMRYCGKALPVESTRIYPKIDEVVLNLGYVYICSAMVPGVPTLMLEAFHSHIDVAIRVAVIRPLQAFLLDDGVELVLQGFRKDFRNLEY